jgi:putative endonuclease
MFYVYILKSLSDGKYYVGHTNNIERRIEDHNRGKNKSVRNRGPFEIIYKEEFPARLEAIRRERQIKSYKGGEAFKRLLSKCNSDPVV